MQRRPPGAVGTLSQASHLPLLTRKRSSLISSASSPHTPTGGNSPLPFFATNTNRNSASSWNSSINDADDIEWEWKSEQIKLLTRTLDALPKHLLTPFNGPVPPSNLLDKIARGVTDAKGPIDWPHSLRATRAKIVELARKRAKEPSDGGETSDTIAEEDSAGSDVPLQQTTNTGLKRPLYRQSSMDFMQPAKIDIKDNGNIRRLSHRLQRTERMLASPTYHPYARSVRSPPPFETSLHSLNSSASSATLNSAISGSHDYDPRKSFSSMSSASEDPFIQPIIPRVRRIKRAETFTSSSLYSPLRSLKRAPSYGGSSRNSLDSTSMNVDYKAKDSDATSSDEEEKLRSKKAKKARTQASSPTPTVPSTPASSKPLTHSRVTSSKLPTSKATKAPSTAIKTSTKPSSGSALPKSISKPKTTHKRNSSLLGPELPNPQPNLAMPTSIHSPRPTKPAGSKIVATPSTINSSRSGSMVMTPPISSPVGKSPAQTPPRSLLRRHKGTTTATPSGSSAIPRRALARKISFGSLLPAAEGENIPDNATGCGLGLGSAFQLR